MTTPLPQNGINYIEFSATDLEATKDFFEAVFHWQFTDYGPDYTSFANSAVNGGFYRAPMCSTVQSCGALVVLYSESLEKTQADVEAAGGKIVKEIFEFPGGRRFHFVEPSGNELAVWSDY